MRSRLKALDFIVTLEGSFDADHMHRGACFDKQHAAMATKSLSASVSLDPSEWALSEFQQRFGVSWEAAVEAGSVLGVAEAAKRLGVTGVGH